MLSVKCGKKGSKQGKLSLFNFVPLTKEQKVIKTAVAQHRRAVEATLNAKIADQQENEREIEVAEEETEVIVNVIKDKGMAMKTKKRIQRPDNWREIALEFASTLKSYRLQKTMNRFKLEVDNQHCINYWPVTLNRWKRDMENDKTIRYNRPCSIPEQAENHWLEK